MDYALTDKVALVTGATSGIGKAIARSFAEEGAQVVIGGLDQAEMNAATAELGERVKGLAGDLTQPGEAQRLYDFALERGPVDFLINNLGIFGYRDFFEATDEEWFRYFDVNVMTGVRLTRLVLKDMLARNSGSVLFTSSDTAVKPLPWFSHYGTTKAAQISLARGLSELTRGTQVRVNSFLPGPTATESVMVHYGNMAAQKGVPVDEVIKGYFAEYVQGSLAQGLIDPDNYGRGVIALMTNPAVNGAAWRMDGGLIGTAF